MKDAYSCDLDDAGLDVSYEQAVRRLRADLQAPRPRRNRRRRPTSGSWAAGAHEFMVLNDYGEDTLVLCDACGYAENQQIAEVAQARRRRPRTPCPMEDVETPDATTIDALARVPRDPAEPDRQGRVLRDRRRAVRRRPSSAATTTSTRRSSSTRSRRRGGLRPAQVEEIKARGMEPGYGSPLGATDAVVVVDELVPRSPNLVAGANRAGWHVRNVNVPRDYTPDVIAEITNAREGDACVRLRVAVQAPQGHRGREHLQARDRLHGRRRGHVPRRGGRAPPHRDGLVRHRARAATSPASSRRTTTRRASPGRPRSRPIPRTSSPSARTGAEGHRDRRARCTPPRPRPAPSARSCSTTATSRRASSSPTPRCSACPGS